MIAVVLIWTLCFFLVILFECKGHFWAFWSTLDDLLTYCVDEVLLLRVMSISDVVTDCMILAIPIPIVCESLPHTTVAILMVVKIWKLQLTPERKLGIMGVFLLGSL